jgi:hypothetical protein
MSDKYNFGKMSVESVPNEYTRFHVDLKVKNGWSLSEINEEEISEGEV